MLGDGSDSISVSDLPGSDPEAISLSLSDTTELFRFKLFFKSSSYEKGGK